jgi:hypothetical protein
MDPFLDLTDRFPFTFDPDRMWAEVRAVEAGSGWLDHYDRALAAGWKAIPLVSRHGRTDDPESQRWGDVREFRRTPVVDRMPYFRRVLDAFACPHGRVRVLKLLPGATVGRHRDAGGEAAGYAYGKVRLHVPIRTNDRVYFDLAGRRVRMAPGRLYYCDFTRPHAVYNGGAEPRVHLVLDLVLDDFLRGVFPPAGVGERVWHWGLRRVMPVAWAALAAKAEASRRFWRAYNGSAAQRLARRVRGRPPRTPAGVG